LSTDSVDKFDAAFDGQPGGAVMVSISTAPSK
jgi:hypothetical protein